MLGRGYLDSERKLILTVGFYHSLGLGSEVHRKEKALWALVFTTLCVPAVSKM